ncbi:MAG: AraC family transcriptional regulator [Kiritimatiellae bacterium]|nr:AraC family transcriptional regulator [Kiritimatiellia bacterium]
MTCRLLLVHPGRVLERRRTRLHTHPFWQLEIVTRGQIGAAGDDSALVLEAGDCFLTPPQTRHDFIYEQVGAEWLTLKFHAYGVERTGRSAERLPHDPFLDTVRAALLALVPASGVPTRAVQAAGESLLASVLSYTCTEGDAGAAGLPPLVRKVRGLVLAHNGRPVTVAEVARQAGYSPGHLSVEFSRLAGEPLKRFIDRTRADVARRMLRYADLRIKEIAEELGFPDVFSFSRFFKRLSGVNPRTYRRDAATPPSGQPA